MSDIDPDFVSIPVPEGTPDLFVIIRKSSSEYTSREPGVVVVGGYKRFIDWDVKSSRAFQFQEMHYDGYSYAFSTMPWVSSSGLWGVDLRSGEVEMYRIRLKSADRIYVVDEEPFLQKQAVVQDDVKEEGRRYRLRDHAAIFGAIARTLIPLADYQGEYKRPIYLIKRPLGNDEASFYELPILKRIHQQEVIRRAQSSEAAKEFDDECIAAIERQSQPTETAPKKTITHLRLV